MNRNTRIACLFLLSGLIGTVILSVYLLNIGEADLLLKILKATNVTFREPPSAFSPFHLCFLIPCILLTVAIVLLAVRRHDLFFERRTDCIVFGFGIIFGLMEVYKQFFSFYVLGSGSYDYALFPFQFCSLPIYVCLLVPLLPNRSAKAMGYRFLALFGTVGGLAVTLFPTLALHVTISLHTLLWHVLMVLLGVFLLVVQGCGRNLRRELLPTAGIFLLSFVTATVMNLLCKDLEGFNMFYLSPSRPTHFFILADVQRVLGWETSVILYAAAFLFLGALPIWYLGRVLQKIREKHLK